MKTLRDMGFKGESFGVHNVEDRSEAKTSGNAMLGMWYANEDDAVGEQFKETYNVRFHSDAAPGDANGFDVAKLFIEAVASGTDLNHYLHTVKNFSGVFGVYSATGRNDFDIPVAVKIVREDGFARVRE